MVYKQRVIPLVWMIYKGKKGHSSADKQIEVLTQVRDLLPKGAKVIITGDAKFNGTEVVTWFKAQPHCEYACRTAKNIVIRTDHQGEAQALEELAPAAGQNCFLSQVYFTQQQIGPVNIAILWNEAAAEHLYLVTSAQRLTEAQQWYKRRFKIETLFADTKSRGFGLHKSGLRDPHRLARFVIAVFLAYIWMI